MNGGFQRSGRSLLGTFCLVLGLLVVLPQTPYQRSAYGAPPLKNHFIGIGNCPPWAPQSLEMCRHSLERVMKALVPRINAEPDSTRLLLNETATAEALKRKATELSNTLGPQDRLILYVNLPLALADDAETTDVTGYVLELWAEEEPGSVSDAISAGTWVSAPAFAAMIHTIPAAEVILLLDTNNPHAVNLQLLDKHAVDHDSRPEALVSSAGAGQAANYSADRTISLFAKHLALSFEETEGTLLDVVTAASSGTRQASIPICAALKENQGTPDGKPAECTQIPEIHDPNGLLQGTVLVPIAKAE